MYKKIIKTKYLAIVLSLVFFCFAFILFSFLQKSAWALDIANYSKMSGNPLAIADWNRLDEDFVAKSGDTMTGDLNVAVISGLDAPSQPLDAVNVEYANNRINLASGGGDIFINWGRQDCPIDTLPVYRGYAFSAQETSEPGSTTEVLCLQSDTIDPGSATASQSNEVYPLALAPFTTSLPSEASFNNNFSRKEIQCAACYNYKGVCYEAWNTNDCAPSFTPIYTGWAMGGKTVPETDLSRELETDVYCVNSNFNSSAPNSVTAGGYFYGLNITNNSDLPVGTYTVGAFVRCAICCIL